MIKGRYYIGRVSASGKNRASSSIDLQPGMNVIYGPSNTGKSYVLSCIRYALGRDIYPIAEELGYDEFTVLFKHTERDDYLEITRKKGSKYEVNSNIPEIPSDSYNAQEYQALILQLIGVKGSHEVYSSKMRRKQKVTFNSFAHFFMIDEERIVSGKSVLFPAGFTNIILEISILDFLLYRIDANSDKASEDIKTKRIKRAAIRAYIRRKITALAEEKVKLENELTGYRLDQNAESILQSYDDELREAERMIEYVKDESQKSLDQIADLEEKHQVAQITLERYRNLASQYESDLNRLDFIVNGNEAHDLFSEPARCPFCDNELHDHKQETDYIQSARNEHAKTQQLLTDLRTAYKTVEDEDALISHELAEKKRVADELTAKIQRVLLPRVRELHNVLDLYKRQTEIRKQLEVLDFAASEYQDEIEEQDKEEDTDKEFDPRSPLEENGFIAAFEKELKEALKVSNYPGLLTCSIDPTYLDIVVNQKKKENQGKGYRAYLNSVYSATLFRHIIENGEFAPISLILDSPILSLKEGVHEEERIGSPMRCGLFNYIKMCSTVGQTILIENDIPEIDYSGVNLVEFTKDETNGRYGFLLEVMN